MDRIGIAASKMAKDNLLLYNLLVVLIVFVLSALLFLIAGGSIFLALAAIGFLYHGIVPGGPKTEWWVLINICMAVLAVAISGISLFAIVKNLKFRK